MAALLGFALRSHDARAGWPPSPGADMTQQENWPNDPDYPRLWQYWSYLPAQAPGTPPYLAADQKLAASGMSVDLAWTYTTGKPEVVIAVLDSGIEWDEPELVNKVALNARELDGAHRPQNAGGGACGGAGALSGYDCNGDGVFSVADYRDDPRVAPLVKGDPCFTDAARTKPGGDRLTGDVNRNCVLDAGDLVAMFSDGIDDDGNGYVDDIAGWDFFKNDPDAYDDTRYGHGTGEAKDSTAEGNNGVSGLGACPGCRFVPLRVGDSFIADANDFAKAAVYAADNGASVVQEALGTVDMTPFARAAIDYAYAKNVLVVASMADENSRHHNLPATANHTMPVHAIRYDGDGPTTSSTFLAFGTCTNYGGQLGLSVSGTSCSSEATGRSAGVAGLLYSYALAQPTPMALTAEEAHQLLEATADDVDVAESRGGASRYYESKPGFDQRFGYGRVNAARAMQAIKTGTLPPEVDIVSPEWFAPLFADRVDAVVPVIGHVAAKRAQSYDYVVEWAPGVEPDDADFHPLAATVANVPATTVSGGTSPDSPPLATFDPRALDTAHTPDPDSPHHENDRTITLRVRAVAHYAGGDVKGEARRAVAVVNARNGLDPDLLPGFPIKLDGSIEAGAKLADIDGDRVRDVVQAASDGTLHVFTIKGGVASELAGFPYRATPLDGLDPNGAVRDPLVPSYLAAPAYQRGKSGGVDPDRREAFLSSPAIGDLDGDGTPEIVASTWNGTIHVVDAKGRAVAGWPKRLPLVPSCSLDPSKPTSGPCMDARDELARGTFASPVLVDLDHDGRPEIAQAAFDGNLYVFHGDGTPAAGWPVPLHAPGSPRHARSLSTPTVADFDGDGTPDFVVGSNETLGEGDGAGPYFMIDGRGTAAPGGPYKRNWPLAFSSLHLYPVIAEGVPASPASADFDGDGRPDVVLQGNGAPPTVVPADPGVPPSGVVAAPNKLPITVGDDGVTRRGFDATSVFGDLSKAAPRDSMFPLFSNPSIGDLDQDGVPDVVMSGGSLSLAGNLAGGAVATPFQHLLAMWSGKSGRMMPGSPVVLEDYTFFMNHAVADLDGDDYPEVVTATGVYFVRAVDACGREAPGFPKFTNGWHTGAPAVGDVDGDHGLEVVAGTREGWLFAWHTRGRDDGVVEWESAHHDGANTGDYARPLGQGVLEKARTPLTCAEATAGADRYEPGGCAVVFGASGAANAGRREPERDGALATAFALAAALVARRRRGAG